MLQNTYTTDELVERLGLMRKYYGERLFAGGKDAILREVLTSECEEYTLKALEEWQNLFAKEDISPLVVYEALDAIEEDLTGIPSVTLYVPVHFSAEHVKRFGEWFRENVQPNILLTICTDPRTSGGCGLIWNDTYHDLSLRYFIRKHRDDIVNVCNEYTHAK